MFRIPRPRPRRACEAASAKCASGVGGCLGCVSSCSCSCFALLPRWCPAGVPFMFLQCSFIFHVFHVFSFSLFRVLVVDFSFFHRHALSCRSQGCDFILPSSLSAICQVLKVFLLFHDNPPLTRLTTSSACALLGFFDSVLLQDPPPPSFRTTLS